MNLPPEKLSAYKNKLAVAQLKYNKLRSNAPGAEIAIVEGSEDSIFYSVAFSRENIQLPDVFFLANGKDNVLGLRDWLSKAKDASTTGLVTFFVDNDFDGLKGHSPGRDLYLTPTYSIENILVSREALSNLLRSDFNLGQDGLFQDIEQILTKFDSLMQQHDVQLKEANELIFYLRQEALRKNILTSGSMDDNCEKYANIDPATLTVLKKATGKQLETLIKTTPQFDSQLSNAHSSEFSKLNSASDWRGKFIFFLFRRFLAILVEDRNTKNPTHFSKGSGKVSIDTRQDSIVRILASICEIPTCLRDFIKDLDKRRLAV